MLEMGIQREKTRVHIGDKKNKLHQAVGTN